MSYNLIIIIIIILQVTPPKHQISMYLNYFKIHKFDTSIQINSIHIISHIEFTAELIKNFKKISLIFFMNKYSSI